MGQGDQAALSLSLWDCGVIGWWAQGEAWVSPLHHLQDVLLAVVRT